MKSSKTKTLKSVVVILTIFFALFVTFIDFLVTIVGKYTGLTYTASYFFLLLFVFFMLEYMMLKSSDVVECNMKGKSSLYKGIYYYFYIPLITIILATAFTIPVLTLPDKFGIFISLALMYFAVGFLSRMSK